jgi:hypothetical protein
LLGTWVARIRVKMQGKEKKPGAFYKVLVAILAIGLIPMASLVAAGLTLSRMSRDVAEPVKIPVEAMISLGPTYGGAHTLVNITGMGFPENDRVSIYIMPSGGGSRTQPYSEALTNAEGMFSVMFPMPASWPDGSAITDESLVVMAMANDTTEQAGGGIVQAVADFRYLPVIQQEISISPASGKEGTLVAVTATGFPSNQQVDIYLGTRDGTRPLTQTAVIGTTDGSGRLAQTFTVPERWPDGALIHEEQLEIVARTKDEAVRASAGFDYEPAPHPSIAVSPNYGGSDTSVGITGDGFPAGSRVLIKLGTSVDDAASRPAYLETRADLQGNIDLPFTMPGFWPGGLPIRTQDIVVLGATDDGHGYAWIGFAYLKFAPSEAAQGNSGSGVLSETQRSEPSVDSHVTSQPSGSENAGTSAPHAAGAQPSISLAPATGGADTMVQVNGAGFPQNVPLTLRLGLPATGFDDTIYGSAVSDGAGNFVTQFTMPATWPDGAPIVETHLVVAVTSGDGAAKAGADFLYVAAMGQETPAVDPCDIRDSLAASLGLASGQLEAAPADVVDPRSGMVYAGCVLHFDVTAQPPTDMVRTALTALGWQEDSANIDVNISVFRAGAGLIVVRTSQAKCSAGSEGDTCPDESTYYTVTIDYVRATTP